MVQGRPKLFVPVVDEDLLHPSFRSVAELPGYSPARGIMEEVFSSFVDVDGNFVREFQTHGFDARVWELYLHALFQEWRLTRDPAFSSPDFVLPIDDQGYLCVEAITTNPSTHVARDAYSKPDPSNYREFVDQVVVGLGSSLHSKMQKEYWTLPHVLESPFVFAIENFSSPESLWFSSSPLMTYLFGLRYLHTYSEGGELLITPVTVDVHRFQEKIVPSGFFHQEDASHVSAVLFSNSATVAKFNRMGQQGPYRNPDLRIFRAGTCHHHDPNASRPLDFIYEVGDPRFLETWSQGVEIIFNPNARIPLMDTWWNADVATHQLKSDGLVLSTLPEFHPYASRTFNIAPISRA